MKRLFASPCRLLGMGMAFGAARLGRRRKAPAAATAAQRRCRSRRGSSAAAPPAAAAAPRLPRPLPPAPEPNKGDNAWMMVCAALVILMSIPGLALFYGGLVRSKNMLSVLMQVFVTFSLISVLWVVYGYSLAFTEGRRFFGVLDKLFLKGVTPIRGATFSKGVVYLRVHLRDLPGRFRGDHLRPDRRRLRRACQVLRGSGLHGLWFTFSYLPMAHMVWYWAGPDAYIDAAAAKPPARPPASCSRRARSTSPAVPWCISTPLSPAWSVPS
jgi:Amt family ammonium transporter